MSNKTPVANADATESARKGNETNLRFFSSRRASAKPKSRAALFPHAGMKALKNPKTWLVLLAIAALLAPFIHTSQQKYPSVVIGDRKIGLEIADSQAEREKGLSGRKTLFQNRGMLFVFGQPDIHCFWMKDTLVKLDIIWLDSNQKIVGYRENMTPESYPQSYCPGKAAKYAIEVNSGVIKRAKIQTGQQLSLRNIQQ